MTANQILGMTISPLTDRIQKSYSLLDISRNIDYVNIEAYVFDLRTKIYFIKMVN